ncbi:acetyltransferase, GNAT family [Bacteriovorax sp. BSW11_IV]|uniref:GNAT family N-acetyltransferase n=1 Tax=Bacteriovorax sp. BSW11_IV TaxID=1353529 RepID=UPI00038A0D72|nr:GNAT family N-acetyltransferase [Bacteriovorax sp. BSW11_IV]EQC44645.1 acetyltransferase, GNAT family [Bacteriovorax sp. BSW11_IV]
MSKIILRHLTLDDKVLLEKAMAENWESNFDFVHYWDSLAKGNFERFIEVIPEISRGLHLPKGHIPCTFLFAFNENNEIVGRTSIRHTLTDYLLKAGGHIGYGVCPSFRRQGYATAILKESLSWVKINLPHLTQVLVTCDEGNMGSQKTIENNGGVLEDIIDVGGQSRKMRFWVPVK